MKELVYEAYTSCNENEKTFLILGEVKDKHFKISFQGKTLEPVGFFNISLGVGGNRFKGIKSIINNHITIDDKKLDYILNTKENDGFKFYNITICIIT